jgi:predicted Fe-S protein YdhL (DUF1289 family)
MNSSSPCLKLCRLDGDGLCLGCFRLREEIARWTQMNDEEKIMVNLAAAERAKIRRRIELHPC